MCARERELCTHMNAFSVSAKYVSVCERECLVAHVGEAGSELPTAGVLNWPLWFM